MTTIKPGPAPSRTQQRILQAAEQLLRGGGADFSMRELAAEAGVSFATPFNRFGSKAGIMRALSDARISSMEARFASHPASRDATGRVRLAIRVAVAVMLEEPVVNRAVMGQLGAPSTEPGAVLARSIRFWAGVLGDGDGLLEPFRAEALDQLPLQLALAFRGALSFWSAGELPDEQLEGSALLAANGLLRGIAAPDDCSD